MYQILKERKKPEYLQALQISYDAQLKLCQKNPASKEQEQSLNKLGDRLHDANKLETAMSELQAAFEKWAPSDDNDDCDGVSWSVFCEEAGTILGTKAFSDNHRVKWSQLMQEAS